ncbi:MAG: NifB/NifX family molybdenum-iron cluster-binding protein [Coriobacteriia bacterium]|nr:NifB/NifX family molybdenum-iron cluster-binding protein [Coriobacteriia bacterium]
MKVAITSLGPTVEDMVDERFGRAMYFIVADTEGDSVDVVANDANRNALGGAGTASAELVSGRGAEAVITGHLGPKAFSGLKAAGIRGYDGGGMTVAAALAAFAEGTLRSLDEAGEAHAG